MQKKTELLQMRTSPDFLEKLDEWRRQVRDIPSRAEAIRRLVNRGILFDALYEQLRILVADGLMPEEGFMTIMDRIGYDARLDDDAPEDPPPPRPRTEGPVNQPTIPGIADTPARPAPKRYVRGLTRKP